MDVWWWASGGGKGFFMQSSFPHRFAERAKKIQNTASVNRDPKAAKAAALYQENIRLKEKVAKLQAHIMELEKYYGD